jgi:hypothetical protein
LSSIVTLLPKKKLTLDQIDQLAEIVDKESDIEGEDRDLINWHKFLDSFVFVG